MKKIIRKSMNAILSLALILTLGVAVFIPNTPVGGVSVSPMSDAEPVTNFYI